MFFLYRVSTMDFIVNAVPLPVMPLSRMTQIVASTPAPQTQNRGRRRVRLGLLGALIPPPASAPVSTCRGPRSGLSLSHNTVAPLIYRLNAISSAVSICGTKPGIRPVISTSASGVRPASTPDIPTAPACRHRSAAGAPTIIHIDPEHRLLPPVSPLGVCRERVFFWSLSEDHQGAPSAGWGVWNHGEPWLRGSHRYVSNIREAGRSNAN